MHGGIKVSAAVLNL